MVYFKIQVNFYKVKMTVLWIGAPCNLVDNFYQTTWRNNPEDIHLHIRRHENLKSHFYKVETELSTKLSLSENLFSYQNTEWKVMYACLRFAFVPFRNKPNSCQNFKHHFSTENFREQVRGT
jgi:hypothetical protein